MSVPKLSINQLVEIIVPEGEVYAGKYKSRVEEVTDTQIRLAMPMKDGALVPLRIGMSIGVEQFSSSAIFVHHTTVLNRILNPVPLLVVGKATSVTKIQRRNYLRWESRLPVAFRIIDGTGQVGPALSSFTRDISGGGALLEIKEAIPADTLIEVEITLPKGIIRAIAKVCRSFESDEGGKPGQMLAALEFAGIDERSRDKIINYIFDQQRELRKKGLI